MDKLDLNEIMKKYDILVNILNKINIKYKKIIIPKDYGLKYEDMKIIKNLKKFNISQNGSFALVIQPLLSFPLASTDPLS